MDITQVITAIGVFAAAVATLWGIHWPLSMKRDAARNKALQDVEDRMEVKVESALALGRVMVKEGGDKLDTHVKYAERSQRHNTQEFESLREDVDVLKAQHMTESKVDRKLDPIIKDIASTKEDVLSIRDENRENQRENRAASAALHECINKVLESQAETAGYLRAKSEAAGHD